MSRLLVQETIFESFMSKLKARLKRLRVGDGLDKTCDIGALVSQDDRLRLAAFVDDARRQGAEVGSRLFLSLSITPKITVISHHV